MKRIWMVCGVLALFGAIAVGCGGNRCDEQQARLQNICGVAPATSSGTVNACDSGDQCFAQCVLDHVAVKEDCGTCTTTSCDFANNKGYQDCTLNCASGAGGSGGAPSNGGAGGI